MTTLRDDIGSLASAFGGLAADLKDNQDKLLALARGLETIVAERTAELAQEKDYLTISVADRTAQLNAANDELRNRSVALSTRVHEITVFSRMNDFLQTSATEAEAYTIISESVPQLFPEDSGAIYVISASRDVLEVAAAWGTRPPAKLVFQANECWAHRRGQVHMGIGRERWCPHVADDAHMYICLPLLAQGEMLGILHLSDGPIRSDKPDKAHMTEMGRLAQILADNIGFGIANLKLRESLRNGDDSRGRQASERQSRQSAPGRHHAVGGRGRLPRSCRGGGGDREGGRRRTLRRQEPRPRSSGHVLGKTRAIYVAGYVAPGRAVTDVRRRGRKTALCAQAYRRGQGTPRILHR